MNASVERVTDFFNLITCVMENLENEIWKSIEGFNRYEVSNLGRVRSLNVTYTNSTGVQRSIIGRILKYGYYKDGYSKVILSQKSILKTLKVHRLVAKAFIPNLENKPYVNHINGIKTDNRVQNLEWVTPKENSQHFFSSDLYVCNNNGEKNGMSKMKKEDIIKIREMRKTMSIKYVAYFFNISHSQVSSIANKKSWCHV